MSSPIACTLTDAEQRARQRKLQDRLLEGLQETVELEDGYAMRFPGEPEWVRALADLVVLERACCPFLSLELAAEPERGPVWLRLRGPEGTREFLAKNLEHVLCRVRSDTLEGGHG